MSNDRMDMIENRLSNIEKDLAETVIQQKQNSADLGKLIEESRGLLEIYKSLAGTMVVGGYVQKFLLWVIKLPVIGAGLYAIFEYFKG